MWSRWTRRTTARAERSRPVRKASKQSNDPMRQADADLNQIVAYNFKAARELRGWTQEEAAIRLEPLLGQRLPQASISAIERAYEGDRHRVFDAHELLAFAEAFNLPLLWFLLPPPGDDRWLRNTQSRVSDLYGLVFGRPDTLPPVYDRLRQLGIDEPTEADVAVEQILGTTSDARQQNLTERRTEVLMALLDSEASNLDRAAEELGSFFDHLRRIGVRGFVAENVHPDPIAEQVSRPPETRPPKGSKP